MPERVELNFRSYYLGLNATGQYEIDLILSAVARAGKAFHSTEGWIEDTYPEEPFIGETWKDRIQNAAVVAATALSDARAEIARLTTETGRLKGLLVAGRILAETDRLLGGPDA